MGAARGAALALLLLPLLIAPHALADGADAPTGGPYDPLDLDLHAFFTADGGLSEEAPAEAALPLRPPAQPGGGNPPLDFALPAPTPVYTQGRVQVTLVVSNEAAAPGRGPQGDSFEVALLLAGKPVEGSAARVAADAVLAPGTRALTVSLAPPGTLYARGDGLGVRVTPLMPIAQEGAITLRVGPDASRAHFEALRVPDVRDLGLAGPGQVAFHPAEEAFRPSRPDARVVTVTARHDAVEMPDVQATAGETVYLAFVGDEPTDVAEAEHESLFPAKRDAAAHVISVAGQEVRVHPGVGIAVLLPKTGQVEVACVRNCPPTFARTIEFAPQVATPGEQRSALIPPPPDRSGIPTGSEGSAAKEENEVPLPAAFVLGAGLAAAALSRRARTRSR